MEKINGIIVNGRVYEIRALDILPLLKRVGFFEPNLINKIINSKDHDKT